MHSRSYIGAYMAPPVTYMVQSLQALGPLITEKEDTKAITASALLSLLRTAFSEPYPSSWGSSDYYRCHSFTPSLCTLRHLGFPDMYPAAVTLDEPGIDRGQLVFAVDDEHLKTREYIRTWGVRFPSRDFFKSHFILALWLPQVALSAVPARISSAPSSRSASPVLFSGRLLLPSIGLAPFRSYRNTPSLRFPNFCLHIRVIS
ncbi:hypothetical protein R3P38DRAFT_3231402 [Favolaschia claudopus]|uniref:Uncharacterized protein n=1 Tax=Favolaschia claudopus TaxID=2862362 RepID=A0AAV9ZL06_9AGAR